MAVAVSAAPIALTGRLSLLSSEPGPTLQSTLRQISTLSNMLLHMAQG